MLEFNIQPFKEPRGFIKLLQWLFAICAFATTVDYSGTYGFNIVCSTGSGTKPTGTAYAKAEYPFKMDHQSFIISNSGQLCPGGQAPPPIQLIGNAQSESVFFVFTGVMSFLYATFMIGVYALADKRYLEIKNATLGDFFVTVILAVFWIAGASAWAHGISNVKSAMRAGDWLQCPLGYTCTGWYHDSAKKLIISVLFGFINFILWSGNIWFLYKETASVLNGVRGQQSNTQTSPGGVQ